MSPEPPAQSIYSHLVPAQHYRERFSYRHVLGSSINRERRLKYLVAALAASLAFCVYLPSLQNDFVSWDDGDYVSENIHILSLDRTFFRWAFFQWYASNWHPLTWISHAMDYHLWGLRPEGHHLTSIVLHSLNTFLVVLLCMALMESLPDNRKKQTVPCETRLWVGLIAGLLFGLHPLHVESVAWVSERKDVLCAFFFLFSVLSYINYAVHGSGRHAPRPGPFFLKWRYLVSVLLFLLALMSKPMAMTLPLVLLILDWYPLDRTKEHTAKELLYEKIPFVVLSVLASVIIVKAQRAGGSIASLQEVPLPARVLVAVDAIFSYGFKVVAPVHLSPFYPYPSNLSLHVPRFTTAILFFLCSSIACVAVAKRKKIFAAVWSSYIIMLLPVLGIVQIGGQAQADRYTYLPTIGLLVLVAIGIVQLQDKWLHFNNAKKLQHGIFIVILVFLFALAAFRTVTYEKVWKSSRSLWEHSIKTEPEAHIAYNNLGLLLYKDGKLTEATSLFQQSLHLNPSNTDALNNLAIISLDKGQLDQALEYAMAAITAAPRMGAPYNTAGEIFLKKAEYGKALEYFMTALSIDSSKPLRYYNIAFTLEEMGKAKDSCSYWASYLKIAREQANFLEVSRHYRELGCP